MGSRVTPNEIGVIVKDGVVTLTGWVDSYTKRWAAEDAAHRVRGVKAVANDIEVRLSSSPRRPTPTSPRRPCARSSGTRSCRRKLEVTVSKGWVTLKGEVEWQYQKQDAERVVRRLTGRQGREQPDHRQAARDAGRTQEEDRAGARAHRGDRRKAHHRRSARAAR